MQMKSELLRKVFSIDAKAVPDAAFLKECHINVRISSTEYFPAHLNIAVGWDLCCGWRALL